MTIPRVYLTLDNCFAVKRWTRPSEWLAIARDLGITCVEASTDNECDPFYTGEEYLQDWSEEVAREQVRTGVRVVNFFTGYSTYRTVGLLHSDERVVRRIVEQWIRVMVRVASRLDAGLGFYFHAFPDSALQHPASYRELERLLVERMAEVARYGFEEGAKRIVLEQMYSPHQTPWTIEGSLEYLRQVYRESGVPSYVAIDTGHQVGQRRFLRPGQAGLQALAARGYTAESLGRMWLGPQKVYDRLIQLLEGPTEDLVRYLESLGREFRDFDYLFADEADCDLYQWVDRVGCYSPIFHLQQTDGQSSGHQAFTPDNNEKGIVRPRQLLQALLRSYRRADEPGLPPKSDDVYLTFEIFAGTADINADVLNRLRRSVQYWREAIPEDGLRLDQLVSS
ncbi:MAG: hypothetical protein JW820_13220 [Spirochaetales bacterium]|nr:hypothetical protein [Spirochaetales bacterium]